MDRPPPRFKARVVPGRGAQNLIGRSKNLGNLISEMVSFDVVQFIGTKARGYSRCGSWARFSCAPQKETLNTWTIMSQTIGLEVTLNHEFSTSVDRRAARLSHWLNIVHH